MASSQMEFGITYAGLGASSVGVLLIGFVIGRNHRSRRRFGLLIALLTLTGTVMISCGGGGGGGGGDPTDEMSYTVPGLIPSTTYFWQVIAEDGVDGVTESEVRSFTTL